MSTDYFTGVTYLFHLAEPEVFPFLVISLSCHIDWAWQHLTTKDWLLLLWLLTWKDGIGTSSSCTSTRIFRYLHMEITE